MTNESGVCGAGDDSARLLSGRDGVRGVRCGEMFTRTADT